MEEQLTSPSIDRLEQWEEDAYDSFSDYWLGQPDLGVKLEVVDDRNHLVNSGDYRDIERLVESGEIYVLGVFRDVFPADYHNLEHDLGPEEKLRFKKRYSDLDDRELFLQQYHSLLDRDIHSEFYKAGLEVEGLADMWGDAKEVKEGVDSSEDSVVRGMALKPVAEGLNVEQAMETLGKKIEFRIDFMYAGDPDAVERFNDGRSVDEPGVPGTIYVGSDSLDVNLWEESLEDMQEQLEGELNERIGR